MQPDSKRENATRTILPTLALQVVAVMVAALQASAQQPTNAAADGALLSAVLLAARTDAGQEELLVDPRPLAADPQVYDVQPEAFQPVSAVVLRQRSDIIRAAGLREVDATKIGQNAQCPGVLVTTEGGTPVDSTKHAGCPKKLFSVLAVGLPRSGTAALKGDEVYDRETQSAARGYWAARVIRTSLGPGGSSVYAADYVLTKRAEKWIVMKVVGLLYTE